MPKKITVMVYMCGSNLESENGAATTDMTEMLKSGFDSEQVNVIVMAGGSSRWWSGLSAEETAIYEISGNHPKQVYSDGLLNMGEADTVSTLLNFGYEKYPADIYSLILWDHGGGPMSGVCWDSLANSDNLTMIELRDALDNSPFAREPLSWIGFDACLMASVETAYMVSPYALYMIASQETEPGNGWNYAFVNGIHTDENGGVTGKRIVDTYFEDREKETDSLTLSCIDLSVISELEAVMDDFFSELIVELDLNSFSALSNMRQGTKSFGRGDTANNEYDLVDLADLVAHYSTRVPELAESVIVTLKRAVVYSRSNMENSNGLSVYHPYYNKALYQNEWRQEYSGFMFSPAYTQYIQRFASIWLGEQIGDWSKLFPPLQITDGHLQNIFTMQLTEDQLESFSSAQMIVLEKQEFFRETESFSKVYVTDDVLLDDNGMLSAEYTGRTLYAVDADNNPLTGALSYQIQDSTYAIYVVYDNHLIDDSVKTLYYCKLNEETNDLEIDDIYIYDEVSGKYTNRLTIDVQDYKNAYFPLNIRDITYESDSLLGFDNWKRTEGILAPGIELPVDWHFHFSDEALSGDELYVSFQVQDTQTNVYSSELIKVQNENIYDIEVTPDCIENDEYRIEVMAQMDTSRFNPKLKLNYTITNLSDNARNYELDDKFVINQTSVVSSDNYPGSRTLAPGNSTKFSVDLYLNSLKNINTITTIDYTLYVDNDNEIPLSLQLSIDVDSFSKKIDVSQPLAEYAKDGITYQLVSLETISNGTIKGQLHIVNNTNKNITKYFNQAVVNNYLLDLEFDTYIDLKPNTETYAEIEIMNEFHCNTGNDVFLMNTNPLERWGVTEISSLSLITKDEDIESCPVFQLNIPLELESNLLESADEPEMVKILDEDGIIILGESLTVLNDEIILTLEIRNERTEDVQLKFLNANINGIDDGTYFSITDTWRLYAETVRYDYIHINKVENVLEQKILESLDMGFMIYNFTNKVQSYNVSMKAATNIPLHEEKGIQIPMTNLILKTQANFVRESAEPIFNSLVNYSEDLESLRKTLKLKLTDAQAVSLESADASVVRYVDNTDEEFMLDNGEPYTGDLIQNLARVKLTLDKDNYLIGGYSGTVLTVEGRPDYLLCLNENGSLNEHMKATSLYTHWLLSDLIEPGMVTLDFDMNVDYAENKAFLDYHVDSVPSNTYLDSVNRFTMIDFQNSICSMLQNNDGTIEFSYYWPWPYGGLKLEGKSVQLTLMPVEEVIEHFRSDCHQKCDKLYVVFFLTYKDGNVLKLGPYPYGDIAS